MSGKQAGMVWDMDLPHTHAWVLMAFADHAEHDGSHIWPSLGLIQWKTALSERQLHRVVADLIEWGILVVVEAGGGNGPTHYRMDASKAPTKAPYEPKRRGRPAKTPDITTPVSGDKPLTSRHPISEKTPDTGSKTGAISEENPCQARDGFVGGTVSIEPSIETSVFPRARVDDDPAYLTRTLKADERRQYLHSGPTRKEASGEALALVQAYHDEIGYPVTKSKLRLEQHVAGELVEIGLTPDEIRACIRWCREEPKFRPLNGLDTFEKRLNQFREERKSAAAPGYPRYIDRTGLPTNGLPPSKTDVLAAVSRKVGVA